VPMAMSLLTGYQRACAKQRRNRPGSVVPALDPQGRAGPPVAPSVILAWDLDRNPAARSREASPCLKLNRTPRSAMPRQPRRDRPGGPDYLRAPRCMCRRAMPAPSPSRLSHASIWNSANGFQVCAQRVIVARSVRTPTLRTIDIPGSDDRAILGQLVTMARPGTKKVNASASSVRRIPDNSA